MKPFFISIFILAFSHVQAQPATGVISGVVTSRSTGVPIPGARITLTHTLVLAHTDTNGAFRLSNIPTGVYELRVSAAGYLKMVCYDLAVAETFPAVVPIKLETGYDSTVTTTMRITTPREIKDRALYYRPDSTIDYKLIIVDPTKSRDSSEMRKK